MKVAEVELLDWSGRVKLVDSICDFILLCPKVGQVISFLLTSFLSPFISLFFWSFHSDL